MTVGVVGRSGTCRQVIRTSSTEVYKEEGAGSGEQGGVF